MTRARLIIGDTLAVLPTLAPASVDLVVCSPPFLALRSYLPADHPDKALEHGSEPTPAAFLATLLDVTEAVGRVLAPHGSLAVELGDSYSGSGGAGGDYGEGGLRDGQERFDGTARAARADGHEPRAERERTRRPPSGWPPAKSLCMVPGLYAASLAYGRNLLALPAAPEWREFAPWRVRNLIAWVRPNPPVGALGDKWRPATSYITVAARSPARWWDDIATRRPYETEREPRFGGSAIRHGEPRGAKRIESNPVGAPLLDWWNITPTGYTSRLGAHYATFPDELVTPLVQAMCPRRVCRTCGTPSRRILSEATYSRTDSDKVPARLAMNDGERRAAGVNQHKQHNGANTSVTANRATLGWTTCGCPGADGIRDDGYHDGPAWRPGMVLDPYCGTGTTLVVATGHGRDGIGIDLNPANAALAEERLGMFLDVDEHTPEEAA